MLNNICWVDLIGNHHYNVGKDELISWGAGQ
jgi:hypothetical protein